MTISGSANWSEASTNSNDENMLIIAGDRDVADVYFTEYMRIFQHFYARWWAAKLGTGDPDSHSFLTEDDTWQGPYFGTGPKSHERDLYANQVAGNT
jgi:phosphatidylserine/phosphatidylglycerophosphate/cardiolipin synthase-like enzyme